MASPVAILLFFQTPSVDCLANPVLGATIVVENRRGYFVLSGPRSASMGLYEGHRFCSDGPFCVLVMICDHDNAKPEYRVFGSVNESVGVAPAARRDRAVCGASK